MNVIQSEYNALLDRIYKRIESENNWCQNAMAKTKNDFPVPEVDPGAVKFCLIGAMALECFLNTDQIFVQPIENENQSEALFDYIKANLAEFINDKDNYSNVYGPYWYWSINAYNDAHTHEQVLTMFRKFKNRKSYDI